MKKAAARIAFGGVTARGALFAPAVVGPAGDAPTAQAMPEAAGVPVEKIGCRWNGPVWVRRPGFDHYDWRPRHRDRHVGAHFH